MKMNFFYGSSNTIDMCYRLNLIPFITWHGFLFFVGITLNLATPGLL